MPRIVDFCLKRGDQCENALDTMKGGIGGRRSDLNSRSPRGNRANGRAGIAGYEIPFNRHFYQYIPPRSLEEIDRDLATVSGEIMELLTELSGM